MACLCLSGNLFLRSGQVSTLGPAMFIKLGSRSIGEEGKTHTQCKNGGTDRAGLASQWMRLPARHGNGREQKGSLILLHPSSQEPTTGEQAQLCPLSVPRLAVEACPALTVLGKFTWVICYWIASFAQMEAIYSVLGCC